MKFFFILFSTGFLSLSLVGKVSEASKKQDSSTVALEGPKGELVDRVVERVGKSRLILQSDIAHVAEEFRWRQVPEEFLYPADGSSPPLVQAKEFLINKHLVNLACEENNLLAGMEQVDAQIKSIIKNNDKLQTEEDLARALRGENKTLEEFKEEITSQIHMRNFSQRFVLPYVKVTEADLELFYLLKTGEPATSVSVEVEQLSFSCSADQVTCSEAEAVYKQLEGASSLGEQAEKTEYDLNSLASEDMKQALENLKPGSFSKPIRVGGVSYIFKLLARKETQALGFEPEKLKVEYMAQLSAAETRAQLKKFRLQHHLEVGRED